jgi:hypothetical protein
MTDPQSARVNRLFKMPWRGAKGLIALAVLGGTMLAQAVPATPGPLHSDASSPTSENPIPASPRVLAASRAQASSPPEASSRHRFWDKENRILFVTVAALSAADFAATRANLQSGGKELDPVTRLFGGSTAGLAANFAGETAAIIGLSYYFHKTGHHRLERLTSMLNIGASSFAVAYDLGHH